MKPYYEDDAVTLWLGDSLAVLRDMADASVNCCVTSPPYFGLRDYGEEGQYGLESSPVEYVGTMRDVFAEVRRVLADDGTLWLNLGDSYSVRWGSQRGTGRRGMNDDDSSRERSGAIAHGVPEKNLMGIPWRVAFALQDEGWTLRNDIIWSKPNAMPESVADRLASRHEHLFMFSKARTYWFDLNPIREPYSEDEARGHEAGTSKAAEAVRALRGERDRNPHQGLKGRNRDGAGRNPGDVWSIPTAPFAAAHFAVMAPTLAERAILSGCKPGGTVLDPFSGSGTTGMVAGQHGRRYVGIDLSADYLDLSLRTRLAQASLLDGGVA